MTQTGGLLVQVHAEDHGRGSAAPRGRHERERELGQRKPSGGGLTHSIADTADVHHNVDDYCCRACLAVKYSIRCSERLSAMGNSVGSVGITLSETFRGGEVRAS